MDSITFDQITLDKTLIGDAQKFLKEEIEYQVTFYDEQVVGLELPKTMELFVTYAPPEIRKATATSSLRPITCENEIEVNAPAFIKEGGDLNPTAGSLRSLFGDFGSLEPKMRSF